MKTKEKKPLKLVAIDLAIVLLGCCLWAFGATAIMLPNGLSDGGISGIARILQQFLPFSFSIIYYGLSLVMLVMAYFFLGPREVRKILFVGLVYPLILFGFEHVPFALLEHNDTILAAIFYGVIGGTGTGLMLWRGYSSAGTDCIAKILKKNVFPEANLSKLLLGTNCIIIISSGLVFGRNIALYALITTYISSRMVDVVLFGFETKVVRIEIIANDEPEETANYIMKEIGRGVSTSEVVGAYTGASHTKLTTFCSPRESTLIRRYIASHDPKAFVTVSRVDSVWGRGSGFHDLIEE